MRKGLSVCRAILPASAALGLAIGVGLLLALAMGESPGTFLRTLFVNTLDSLDSVGYVLFYATPLIFTGLAVGIGFQAGLFNIGCEGQLYVGAFAAATMALMFSQLPGILLFPLSVGAALIAGAAWAGIPGWLRARFGAHEVITTIMMNFIAFGVVDYFVLNHLKSAEEFIPQTREIPPGIRLPRLGAWLPGISQGHPLELSFGIALGMAVLLHIFLKHTVWGYRLRMMGRNPEAVIRAGVSETRIILLSMGLSGALAAWVGVWDVLGYHYRFLSGFNAGWGFLGIAVALLARNHPLGVIPAALFLGLLSKGALDLELLTSIPREVVLIIESLAILLLAVALRWNIQGVRGYNHD